MADEAASCSGWIPERLDDGARTRDPPWALAEPRRGLRVPRVPHRTRGAADRLVEGLGEDRLDQVDGEAGRPARAHVVLRPVTAQRDAWNAAMAQLADQLQAGAVGALDVA